MFAKKKLARRKKLNFRNLATVKIDTTELGIANKIHWKAKIKFLRIESPTCSSCFCIENNTVGFLFHLLEQEQEF